VVLDRRLSWCFPASLETYQREHPELALLCPVVLTARPGRLGVEEILLVAVHGYQVGHQLTGHRQRGAIGISFLLFPIRQIVPSGKVSKNADAPNNVYKNQTSKFDAQL